jgi:hypothetical protein
VKWRIYYADGSTYSGSTDKEAFNAKAIGVQAISVEAPKRNRGHGLVTGYDMYLYKGDRWFGCDNAGMYDYLMTYPGPNKVLFGRTMAKEEEWNAIVSRAKVEGLGE